MFFCGLCEIQLGAKVNSFLTNIKRLKWFAGCRWWWLGNIVRDFVNGCLLHWWGDEDNFLKCRWHSHSYKLHDSIYDFRPNRGSRLLLLSLGNKVTNGFPNILLLPEVISHFWNCLLAVSHTWLLPVAALWDRWMSRCCILQFAWDEKKHEGI